MLEGLNQQQYNAVVDSIYNNSLVIAGAGSGKTRVLTTRVQYIIEKLGHHPSSIMCITFTNKAAKELLSRIEKISDDAHLMWIGTYHSICVRFLKMFGNEIGLGKFSILDSDESKKVAKDVLVKLGLEADAKTMKMFMSKMSFLKNNLVTDKMYRTKTANCYIPKYDNLNSSNDYDFTEFYTMYQEHNRQHHLLDFDDLILYTLILINKSKTVQDYIKNTFKFVCGDEVQDSNINNFMLLKSFSKDCNLFIVGDEDQSIYGFRGAKPEALMEFMNLYKNSKIFKLEQNYRSTKNIVEASNFVIYNNDDRVDKVAFSENEKGEKITYLNFDTSYDEADYIADEAKNINDYGNTMVLYRTNSQSNIIEKAMIKRSIPYKIMGSISFNDRKIVKDCMAFLRVFINRKDKISFLRAMKTLNGVGPKLLEDLSLLFDTYNDANKVIDNISCKNKKAKSSVDFMKSILSYNGKDPLHIINKFTALKIEQLKGNVQPDSIKEIGLLEDLLQLAEYEDITIEDFVYKMDLLTSGEEKEDSDKVITLMTMHSSKGLESDYVFLAGINEGIIPHENSIVTNNICEERRLLYVAMTRARKKLYITNFNFNLNKNYTPSRFLKEIPDSYIEEEFVI